jgi:predicted esterase
MRQAVAAIAVLVCALPVAAQSERYELGRRLKTFESAWEKQPNQVARDRALALLPKVTSQFFSLQLAEAGRTLDLAAFALQADIGPSTSRQWAWSLSAIPESRIVDGAAKELAVTIQPFYPVKGDLPKNLELQLWFIDRQVVTVKPKKFPVVVKVPLPPLGELPGLDRKLYFLADGGKDLRPFAVGVSQIADMTKRFEKLTEATKGKNATIEEATARARAMLLRVALNAKEPLPPTDFPYADLLANAERMLDGKPFFTTARHGQFWLSVPVGERDAVACRVFVPKGLDMKKPVPVVIALHGAGVDENMFFESYGAGQTVKECEKRGWVLVAPRSGLLDGGLPVAELLEKLAERYPLDRKHVLVVGHSMGAAQALAQAAEGKFAALALLGGGRAIAKPAALATLPLFIGVGEKDPLALNGARALHKSLTDAGAKAVAFKEYPKVEHLVIVRAAMDDVFALFDKVCRK